MIANRKKVTYYYLSIIVFLILIAPILTYSQNTDKSTKTKQSQIKNRNIPENGNSTNTDQNTGQEGSNAPAYQYKAPTFETGKVSYPKLVLKTVAVLAIIVFSIFILFRILVKNKNKMISDSEIIKVLATFPLAANRMIQIVDIGGKVLVLGVTDSNINLITTIEDKEVIDNIKLYYSKEKAEKTGFKDQFLKLLGGRVFTKTGQISYLDNYKKRIKRMKKL